VRIEETVILPWILSFLDFVSIRGLRARKKTMSFWSHDKASRTVFQLVIFQVQFHCEPRCFLKGAGSYEV
jgi:hypothetical protein